MILIIDMICKRNIVLLILFMHQKGPFNKTIFPPQGSVQPSAFAKEGRNALPFDIELDGHRMDLSTEIGFANALWAIGRLRPGGGHLTAPVCSTFVIVFPGSSFI